MILSETMSETLVQSCLNSADPLLSAAIQSRLCSGLPSPKAAANRRVCRRQCLIVHPPRPLEVITVVTSVSHFLKSFPPSAQLLSHFFNVFHCLLRFLTFFRLVWSVAS